MPNNIDPKLMEEFCRISRVCDVRVMADVLEKARQIGCNQIAAMISADLIEGRYIDGRYIPLVAQVLEEQL